MRPAAASLALALTLMTASTHATPARDEVRFPSVAGRSLEGRELRLPADLEGERNVLVIAFKREQQRDADSWKPALAALVRATPGLAVYGLPTLPTGARTMRWLIERGMRRGAENREVRERTIPLYVDTDAFRRALAIPDEAQIHVLLVDRAGLVLWRASGTFDEARMAELRRAVVR
jgi:hypothetical protein